MRTETIAWNGVTIELSEPTYEAELYKYPLAVGIGKAVSGEEFDKLPPIFQSAFIRYAQFLLQAKVVSGELPFVLGSPYAAPETHSAGYVLLYRDPAYRTLTAQIHDAIYNLEKNPAEVTETAPLAPSDNPNSEPLSTSGSSAA